MVKSSKKHSPRVTDKQHFSMIMAMALLPALGTLIAFYFEIIPYIIYFASKACMVLLPLWVWYKKGNNRSDILNHSGFKKTTTLYGFLSGLLLSVIVIVGYKVFFADNLDGTLLHTKLASLDILTNYWMVAVFICLWNSALEEWFWRGFIVERLHGSVSATMAIILSSVLFGVHHYITLIAYFPIHLAAFFSFGTIVAGAVWAYMRIRGLSLIDCWISHVMADLAVVSIGWIILQQSV